MVSQVNGTLTKAEIAEAIGSAVGISASDAYDFVRTITDQINAALARGEPVKIPHFGTFNLIDKGERPGRNPANGDEVVIAARRVVSFSASRALRLRVSGLETED